MARKGVLNAENLVALGADRLAALLIEAAADDPSLRKRLVLAMAAGGGTQALIKAIDRRLTAVAAARGFISWDKARAYAGELDGLRESIAQALAAEDPAQAAQRLSAFIRLSPKVLGRAESYHDRLLEVFSAAVADLGAIWARLPDRDPAALAAEAFELLDTDESEVCTNLVTAVAPALGEVGLAALSTAVRTALAAAANPGRTSDESWRTGRLRRVLARVADARGDVDGYIAVEIERGGHINIPGIAERLLDAGRAAEALEWLDRPPGQRSVRVMTYGDLADLRARGGEPSRLDRDLAALRVRALDALGRPSEAQAVRWSVFEQDLDFRMLRDYLRALPDFEDDEALRRAFPIALGYRSAIMALDFLVAWPEFKLAAELVMARTGELDGGRYEVLVPAAEALAERHPHAATILYRRLIDNVLERAASKAYPHAAAHLAACAALADRVDWARYGLAPHAEYLASLRRGHGRKPGFWSRVPAGSVAG